MTGHLGTDEVDVVVLNDAPMALTGRVLGSRRVILDRDPFRRHLFESIELRKFFDFRVLESKHLPDAPVVDRALLLRKLADLERYLAQLGEYRTLTSVEYQRDWRIQRIVDRTLQLAIELASDVAAHVISDRRLRPPATYAETFEVLAEAGLLEPLLRDSLVRMARFRNLLVHDYARIDPEIVVRILRENLSDLEAFRRTASGWT